MKISDFIGEATEYDKKEMLEERRPRSWLKSVSAFANGIGGALIFGVSDEEILVGLTDARADVYKRQPWDRSRRRFQGAVRVCSRSGFHRRAR